MHGDSRAFHKLYEEEQAKVRRILYRITLCNRDSLDELTQEVFLKAWRARSQRKDPENCRAWLYQIAYVTAVEAYRELKSHRSMLSDESNEALNHVTKHSSSDTDALIIREALAKLNTLHRAVLILFELEGWTMEECAATMQVPLGTVKSRLFHGRQKLREILEGGSRYAGSR